MFMWTLWAASRAKTADWATRSSTVLACIALGFCAFIRNVVLVWTLWATSRSKARYAWSWSSTVLTVEVRHDVFANIQVKSNWTLYKLSIEFEFCCFVFVFLYQIEWKHCLIVHCTRLLILICVFFSM